ncbi:hypothetical protein M9H77_36594 [Catharanthus roseus]|uniref:Uncharacterized protein n=1 Tax=Catharanthus roseus TaxID=4058 RepID=A0ACB9ZT98_CATRO|nr:hypothetical protein M9H77_36594 [Catharanthus roseus]
MKKNVCLYFIRPYGQDIQVKLCTFDLHNIKNVSVSECLALIRRKRSVCISSVLLVNINPQVSISECLAPIPRKRCASATVDAMIFKTKNVCLFFIHPYGQDITVKLFLLGHINPQVSISKFLAPIRRKR